MAAAAACQEHHHHHQRRQQQRPNGDHRFGISRQGAIRCTARPPGLIGLTLLNVCLHDGCRVGGRRLDDVNNLWRRQWRFAEALGQRLRSFGLGLHHSGCRGGSNHGCLPLRRRNAFPLGCDLRKSLQRISGRVLRASPVSRKVLQLLRQWFLAVDRQQVSRDVDARLGVWRHVVTIHPDGQRSNEPVSAHIEHLLEGDSLESGGFLVGGHGAGVLIDCRGLRRRQPYNSHVGQVGRDIARQVVVADVEEPQSREAASNVGQVALEVVVLHGQHHQLGKLCKRLREVAGEVVVRKAKVHQRCLGYEAGGREGSLPFLGDHRQLVVAHIKRLQGGVQCQRGRNAAGELVESHVEEAQVGGVTQIAGDGPREAVAADVEGGQVRSQP
mmetsp:Transcript_9617/g.28952  ORF Transcript_9617/g.28952 Transcript_9617/m.28952 type:complete len:385 (+) Transcript_9617:1118-2272(+)